MQGVNTWHATRSTCPYCGVGCGVSVSVATAGSVAAEGIQVSGDQQHPANFGRLCSKGAALTETLDNEGRLLYPIVDGQRASWEEALDRVAYGFKKIIVERLVLVVNGSALNG